MSQSDPPDPAPGNGPEAQPPPGEAGHGISLRDAVCTWLKIGLLSFGGPVAQIAVMHRLIVDEKRWISEQRFLHALNFCMLLPGPEAMQLATYLGWLMHKRLGGWIAGMLFILPGALCMLALSVAYVTWHDVDAVTGALLGMKPAVLAIVLGAMARIARRTLRTRVPIGIAAGAFLAIWFLDAPFPAVIAIAGVVGYAGGLGREQAPVNGSAADDELSGLDRPLDRALERGELEHARPRALRTVRTLVVGASLAALPVGILAATAGIESLYFKLAVFFGSASLVTFGGAYAVLTFVAQQVVDGAGGLGWIAAHEMMDGLGLAETTPGPLILVVQFVGFLAAHHQPEGMSPLAAGIIGSAVVLWVTFAPSFLFVFLGGPYIERLRSNRALSGVLRGITAAVVGVILNLAVWFAVHTLFGEVHEARLGLVRLVWPALRSVDLPACAIAALAMAAMWGFRRGTLQTLGGGVAIGIALRLAGVW